MNRTILILAAMATIQASCIQNNKSISRNAGGKNEEREVAFTIEELAPANTNSKFIDSQYEYTNAHSEKFIIQNSLPKGGLTYTDTQGNDFVYFVFWSRIVNNTGQSIKLAINFPADSFELSSNLNFTIMLPSEEMTPGKEHLFNYGLNDIDALLDTCIYKATSLQKEIMPNDMHAFYVVVLYNLRVEGVVRTALTFKNQKLFYRVNEYGVKEKELPCGQLLFYK